MTSLVQTAKQFSSNSVDSTWSTKFALIWNTLKAFELSGLS